MFGSSAVQPGRQPPGAVAEQRHDRGGDDHADDQHVDQDRDAEAEAEHLADEVVPGDEAQEHPGHDQAGEDEDLADAADPVDHALARPVALVVGLVDPAEQEDVVVHAQPEQDREQHDRQEGDDRDARVGADQARADALLEHGHDHAVGGRDRQQVEERRDERDPQRAEHHHQQQHREADHERDEDAAGARRPCR